MSEEAVPYGGNKPTKMIYFSQQHDPESFSTSGVKVVSLVEMEFRAWLPLHPALKRRVLVSRGCYVASESEEARRLRDGMWQSVWRFHRHLDEDRNSGKLDLSKLGKPLYHHRESAEARARRRVIAAGQLRTLFGFGALGN